jgi:Transposase DDE domain
MQKYIQDTINNNLRSIISSLSRPQQKAITEITRGLFTAQKPILKLMAQYQDVSLKKQSEKYSYHLGNVDLTTAIDSAALRKARTHIQHDTIIPYDLSDIQKEHSKKMEGIHDIWDGSKRRKSRGFALHGVGMNNVLLKLQVHEAYTKTLPQVRREIMEEVVPALNGSGIWVFDRGNDSKGFYRELLQVHKVRFIARLKENRFVVNGKTGEYLAVKDMAPGVYQIYLLDHHNHMVDRQSGMLTLVIDRHLSEKEPIRLLSNLLYDQYGRKHIVRMYLDRWGIENIFKRAKTKFQLEKIRVLTYQKLINLVALIQFAINVSSSLFLTIQEQTNGLIVAVILLYKQYQKRQRVTFNIDSFLSFMQSSLQPLQRHLPRPPPMQLCLLSDQQLC